MAGPYYTTEGAKQNSPTLENRIVRGLEIKGGLAYFDCDYTLLGTEAATEVIRICRNHPEMKMLHHLSCVQAENPGTALVIDIGDDDDTDKYADGLVLSAGGTVLITANPGIDVQNPVITEDGPDGTQGDWIYATIATATSLTADQTVRFKLVFAVNS